MRQFWRTFRLILLAAMAVVIAVYAWQVVPWRKMLGISTDYTAQIAEGQPIVDAIYRFKAQRGLWPEYLDDLAPDFLKTAPGPEWFYDVAPVGDGTHAPRKLPALSIDAPREGSSYAHLAYDFDPAAPAWRIIGGPSPRVIKQETPPPSASAPREAILAELDRRIAREPNMLDHWRDKAGVLAKEDDQTNDRSIDVQKKLEDFLQKAQEQFPESAWPKLASAAVDYDPKKLQAYDPWASEHPSFTRAYGTFWLNAHANRSVASPDDQAAKDIEQAIDLPIRVDNDDDHTAGFYLWDMARWALRQQRWDLAIEIANTWEKAVADHRVTDESFHAIRAAAHVAKSDFAAAQKDLDAIADQRAAGTQPAGSSGTSRPWARHIGALARAIESRDATFRYDPGDVPGEYDPFVAPE